MSELIAFALASLPLLAFVALVVEALRLGTGPGIYPPVEFRHRAHSA